MSVNRLIASGAEVPLLGRVAAAGSVLALLTCPQIVSAQTLKQAIQQSVSASPLLRAQSAEISAVRERVDQAVAGYLPNISANASRGFIREAVANSAYGSTANRNTAPGQMSLDITQTIFDGGRRQLQAASARAGVAGAREGFRNVEQDVIYLTAAAYMDVLRAREILTANRENARALQEQLRVLRGRHQFGDVTVADVAHAESRLAEADFRLSSANAVVAKSIATYREIVGRDPRQLSVPGPLRYSLPRDVETALRAAFENHPLLKRADHMIESAEHDSRAAIREFLPTVGLRASMSRGIDLDQRGDRSTNASILAQMTVPIFEGGVTTSRVRENKAREEQRRAERDALLESIRSGVVAAWANWRSASERLAAGQRHVAAAGKAARDVASLYRFGEKSLPEVLQLQSDLLGAHENLAGARRDLVVASFELAQATGTLTLHSILQEPSTPAPLVAAPQFTVNARWSIRSGSGASSPLEMEPDGLSLRTSVDTWR